MLFCYRRFSHCCHSIWPKCPPVLAPSWYTDQDLMDQAPGTNKCTDQDLMDQAPGTNKCTDQDLMDQVPPGTNKSDQTKGKRKDRERKKETDRAYRLRCKENKMKTQETLAVITEKNKKLKRKNRQLREEQVRLQGIVKTQKENMKQLHREFDPLKDQLDRQNTVVDLLSKQLSYQNMAAENGKARVDVDTILKETLPSVTLDQLFQNPNNVGASQAVSRIMIIAEELQRILQMMQNIPSLFSQQAGLLPQFSTQQQTGSIGEQPIPPESAPATLPPCSFQPVSPYLSQPLTHPSFAAQLAPQSQEPYPLQPSMSTQPPTLPHVLHKFQSLQQQSQQSQSSQAELQPHPNYGHFFPSHLCTIPSTQYPLLYQHQPGPAWPPELPVPTSDHGPSKDLSSSTQ